MEENRIPRTIRLTPAAQKLLDGLSQRLGLNKTAIIELAVRRLAASEGVPLDPAEERKTNHGG